MIHNFNVIENFMQFEKGTFYKFECLVRNTDGENILYEEGFSKTNKNILVKSWYVDNLEYYNKIKQEMIKMCNLTGARLYITLDRKSNVKLVQELIHALTDTLCDMIQGKEIGIKSLSKIFASKTSVKETSDKKFKTIMFDVDTKDVDTLDCIQLYIENKGQKPYILETKKGYHVFCYRKFDICKWQQESIDIWVDYCKDNCTLEQVQSLTHSIKEYVSVKDNELGLVYHPNARKEDNVTI